MNTPPSLDGRDAIAMIPTGGVFIPSTLIVADIEGAIDAPSYLSSKELRRQLRRTPGFKHLEVQLYERWVYPLAGLVLLLLALPIALGGDGVVDAFLRFLACGALAFAYFFASNVCYELGAREVLSPVVAAFAPLATFGLVGLWLTLREGGRRG
jgi:lipopolysaccharide export LptBFGC system permease protein LptF